MFRRLQVENEANVLRSCQDVPVIQEARKKKDVCDMAVKNCSATEPPGPVCQPIKAIDSIWKMQLYIRQHGGVVSRLNINNPKAFTEFFESVPTGVFEDATPCVDWPSCGQPYGHAVLIIGYNNTAEPPYWIGLNSWGTDWADKGIFRIKYGISGEYTYCTTCRGATQAALAAL